MSAIKAALERGVKDLRDVEDKIQAAVRTYSLPNNFRVIERMNLGMNYLHMARVEVDTALAFIQNLQHKREQNHGEKSEAQSAALLD